MHGIIQIEWRRWLGYSLVASPFVVGAFIAFSIGGWDAVIIPFGAAIVVYVAVLTGLWLIFNSGT